MPAVTHEHARDYHWNLEEIDRLRTEEIIRMLHRFGVPFDTKSFLEQVEQHHSAFELGSGWIRDNHIKASGFDVDFIWMSSEILWGRLAPEKINSEHINDLMQDGYTDIGNNNIINGCTKWLNVWEHLKENFTSDMNNIDDAEKTFEGLQILSNWCQDLETELWNAALKDEYFHHELIRYCDEFCNLFPESLELIIVNMYRAKADSLYAIEDIEKGEEVYKKLIHDYPDNAWGYIGWGDIYAHGVINSNIHIDNEKARKIYQLASNREMEDYYVISERLVTLQAIAD
jgi:tetratricopeptide (TPR) repeat protein